MKNKKENARRNHCYALVNGTSKREETEQLLAILSFTFNIMKRGIQDYNFYKIIRRPDSPLAWYEPAMQYVRMRLGEDICRQHLDGGGVRVDRAW